MIVIIWVVGLALLGILGFALYSSRKNAGASSEDDGEPANRADVVAEIAALDEEYESGAIDENEYRDQREDLKQLALELDEAAPVTYSQYVGESEEPEK